MRESSLSLLLGPSESHKTYVTYWKKKKKKERKRIAEEKEEDKREVWQSIMKCLALPIGTLLLGV